MGRKKKGGATGDAVNDVEPDVPKAPEPISGGEAAGSSALTYTSAAHDHHRSAVLAVAVLSGVSVSPVEENRRPTLETADGVLFEHLPILRHVARIGSNADQLLGGTPYEQSLIDSWCTFGSSELELPRLGWVGPLLGTLAFSATLTEQARGDVEKSLGALNSHLTQRTYLATERITVADIYVASVARDLFVKVLDPSFRKRYPHVTRWFTTVVNQESFVAAAGPTQLAASEAKAEKGVKAATGPKPSAGKAAATPAVAPATGQSAVVSTLVALGVDYNTPQDEHIEDEKATWCKTVFVKDKKSGNLFVVTAAPSSKIDLKGLAKTLNAKELRLAGQDSVSSALGINAGCITAMSVVGDSQNQVTSVVDQKIPSMKTALRMCSGCSDAQDHTQHRIASVPPAKLMELLSSCGHAPKLVAMPDA